MAIAADRIIDGKRMVMRAGHRTDSGHMAIRTLIRKIEMARKGLRGRGRQTGMSSGIKAGGTTRQFSDIAQKEIVLDRLMRRRSRVRPSRTEIVVTLGTQIDAPAAAQFISESVSTHHIRTRQMKIISGSQSAQQLHWIAIGLMRIVAGRAGDRHIVIIGQCQRRSQPVEERHPCGSRMAGTARIDVGNGGCHSL